MDLYLSLTVPGKSVPDLAQLAAFGEELGYHGVWLAEVAGPDSFVLSAAVASATRRGPVGVAVVPAYTRTPAVLAMAAASVSQMLDGRAFRLGIGSSSQVIVEDWNGVEFARPVRRVEETVEAVRTALSGGEGYQGETVAMRRFRLASPPAGPIELYVGALGPRMLAVAGRVADGVCLNLMPPRMVPVQLAEVRRAAAEAGRSLDRFEVMARLQVLVTDDLEAARQTLRRSILGAYLAQPVYNRFLRWMGYREEADAIADAFQRRDRESVYRAIHDRMVDDLAVVGPLDRVKERLAEYAEAGIRQAAISVLDPDAVERTLTALAPR